jgi:hypothetical protein
MNQEPPTNSGASKSKRLLFVSVLFVCVMVIAGIAGFKYWLSIPPKEVVQADEGFKKAKATIDPEKLRAWALEEILKQQSAKTNFFIPNLEIPTYIRNLYSYAPDDIEINGNTITIWWGGGFFHWMIDIGPTNFVETTGAENIYTTVEWVPGIYYSREDTRHPFK